MAREIPLNKGRVALVDDEDYERVSHHRWYIGADGYARATAKRQTGCELMHRFVLKAPPGFMMDHRDGNRLNNTRANLRLCTNQQNARNSGPKPNRVKKASRFKGVCWHGQRSRWVARIHDGKKNRYLGLFESEEAAAHAYDEAAKRLYGEFARLNLPP